MKFPDYSIIRKIASNFEKTLGPLCNVAARHLNDVERLDGTVAEIKTARILGRNTEVPLRYFRWPIWAQIARDHGLIDNKRNADGKYCWIGKKGLVLPFYTAAKISDSMSEAAFIRLFLDEDGRPLSHDAARTRKKLGTECKLSDQIIKELEKALIL